MNTIEKKDLKKWAKEDSSGSDPSDARLRVVKTNYDYNINHLYNAIKIEKNINVSPDFQRRSRWDNKKRSKLIESLLMGIPVPSIFLFENELYQYEVIDGKQRLETIVSFLDNEFKLTGLEFWNQYENHSYKELPNNIERTLLRQTISATVLLAESGNISFDGTDIRMILFDRLNTGGITLNYQEIRNAVYSGNFNELLYRLSSTSEFRTLWKIPSTEEDLKKSVLYITLTDCELVLRYFTIKEIFLSDMKGSLKHLQDLTMRKYRNLTSEQVSEFENEFLNSLRYFLDKIGPSSFVLPGTGKVARNLYDSLTVAYSQIKNLSLLNNPTIIESNITKTLNDIREYEKIITKGNSIEAIKYRVNKAIEILTETIE